MSVSRIQAVTARAGYRSRYQSPSVQSGRRGQVLLEFAVVAFLMTLLLGAILAFGFLFYSANIVQQAADVGAQELARTPFSPDSSFKTDLVDINKGVFSEAALVVPVGTDPATLPLINQLLFLVYIYDPDIDMIRYPGTLVTNGDGDQTVVIAVIGPGHRNAVTGVEEITEWHRVVEEIIPSGQTAGPYSVLATAAQQGGLGQPGMVALRINYPYQSAGLVAYVHTDEGGNIINPSDTIGADGVLNVPVIADDSQVTGANTAMFPDGDTLSAAGYTLVNPTADPNIGASPNRGTYGFGEAQAFLTTVRPYRKVITAQGIYRREIFE
ncbi:TadE-like protein [Gimesia chilikensis]|uniref:TadE-like protein n=1 Tax=Gimesia chilikensis TaxID=2605989 RepID=A0A517WGN6_9PLAN|nr:TadE family protein [Gimesia chilikensis]QDU04420.1 TadE-like protein [Gimesia chilikensis]